MGLFLGLSGIIGKSQEEVVASLSRYLSMTGGGLGAAMLDVNDPDCCILDTANGNTTIIYPGSYLEWDDSSAFISNDLKSPVFSLHIHDGDFWIYLLYVDGQVVDQFNPIPDYWDDNISLEDKEICKGNAEIVAKYVPGLNPDDIDKYLTTWQLDDEERVKAYPSDEYVQEDWQLLDFMRKLGLPYPLDDNFKAIGKTYRLWTKQLKLHAPIEIAASINALPSKEANPQVTVVVGAPQKRKAWWRFW